MKADEHGMPANGAPPMTIAYNECQEAVKRLTEFLDKELGPNEEAQVQQHLRACRGCFTKFHFEETLLRTIRERVEAVRAPSSLRDKILGLIAHTPSMPVDARHEEVVTATTTETMDETQRP